MRIIAYVDGFNLYHSLSDKPSVYPTHHPPPYEHYKWLNLKKLVELSPASKLGDIVKIHYFTAYTIWDFKKQQKHELYIKALQSQGVEPVFGKFKLVQKKCRGKCREYYPTHEEKQTDVNIAVQLLTDAINDLYDVAILITGDTDLIPAVEAIIKTYPSKQIYAMIPPFRATADLIKSVKGHMKIKESHLQLSQFSDVVATAEGDVKKPFTWSKPAFFLQEKSLLKFPRSCWIEEKIKIERADKSDNEMLCVKISPALRGVNGGRITNLVLSSLSGASGFSVVNQKPMGVKIHTLKNKKSYQAGCVQSENDIDFLSNGEISLEFTYGQKRCPYCKHTCPKLVV